MINFLQPGMILIVTGLLVLLIPERLIVLRRSLLVLAPVLTLWAVLTSGAGKMELMFGIIFAFISLVGALYNFHVKDRFEIAAETVYAGASISVVFAETWINMIVFWELMAVASWLIVVSARTEKATKAGFRYLLVHMFGGNLLLGGIIIKLVQGENLIGNLTADGLGVLTDGPHDAAFWLILAGVALNAAVPPLHAWIADAYPEAPMGGTVYMGSFTTKVGVFCLIKLFAGTELLLYFGVGMALFGACMALMENDLRRLFAYHIVSQVGYMVASLAFGGAVGIDGAAAHAFNNILYKGTLLMCAGTLIDVTGKRKISELGGLGRKMPLTAACFLTASMAIAGFPLLNGFVSKSLIMNAAAASGIHWAELGLMLASVGTLMSVTLKINYFVFWGKSDVSLNADESAVPLGRKIAMVMASAGCFVCGVLPNFVYGLTPYGSDGHPFTVDHVTQYMQLFAAAGIAFLMYLDHMKPHDELSLDIDWLYRKPLPILMNWLSVKFNNLRMAVGGGLGKLIAEANRYLHNPQKLAQEHFGAKEPAPRDCLEDDDVLQKPAGWLVEISFIIFFAVLLYVFARIA